VAVIRRPSNVHGSHDEAQKFMAVVGELLFPTRIYGWSGLCAMSVMTTWIICLVGDVSLVGSDQGLGYI
jgi:hypothetical protein